MTDVRSATKIVTALCDSLAGFINDLCIYIYSQQNKTYNAHSWLVLYENDLRR